MKTTAKIQKQGSVLIYSLQSVELLPILKDGFVTEGCDCCFTRGTLVVVDSDMLSSVTLVSLTLSTERGLWEDFLVLHGML